MGPSLALGPGRGSGLVMAFGWSFPPRVPGFEGTTVSGLFDAWSRPVCTLESAQTRPWALIWRGPNPLEGSGVSSP